MLDLFVSTTPNSSTLGSQTPLESRQVALYRSDDGTVVEAELVADGMVRFWELGGNFRMTISNESFARSFKPHSPSDSLRDCEVHGSWLPEDMVLQALCDETRWNGWVSPKFTLETGLLLTRLMEGQLTFDSEADAFVDLPEGYEDPVLYGRETVAVNGAMRHVYSIGAGSWCWALAECR